MAHSSKTKIWQFGVNEIAEMISRKEISCLESVTSHLERIEETNSKINAASVVLYEAAIESAREADRKHFEEGFIPPLMGVPMTVKENIDCTGSATTFGVRAMKDVKPSVDAPHIKNLKDAGAIVIGRTNTPDLGLRIHTDNDLRGATLNPWNLSHTPGGSSGGDAAAVAAGMTPLGIGNDYGGSLRCPANFCGITTIRPSIGRVPDHMSLLPAEPAITMQLFMVQGPLARHVSDLRTVLEIMSQYDERDPRWLPVPFLGAEPSRPVRVAMVLNPGGIDLEPAVENGIRSAAEALTDAGYLVEEAEPPNLDHQLPPLSEASQLLTPYA
jgi:amidase